MVYNAAPATSYVRVQQPAQPAVHVVAPPPRPPTPTTRYVIEAPRVEARAAAPRDDGSVLQASSYVRESHFAPPLQAPPYVRESYVVPQQQSLSYVRESDPTLQQQASAHMPPYIRESRGAPQQQAFSYVRESHVEPQQPVVSYVRESRVEPQQPVMSYVRESRSVQSYITEMPQEPDTGRPVYSYVAPTSAEAPVVHNAPPVRGRTKMRRDTYHQGEARGHIDAWRNAGAFSHGGDATHMQERYGHMRDRSSHYDDPLAGMKGILDNLETVFDSGGAQYPEAMQDVVRDAGG
eukprot:NODE_1174_length_1221_cov_354.323328.p1 GENE.NODE_1174_length_1221_cov_354.323328~~NODE_1174_length_1221_cov_354.323328.p1  ORF type:complete len:319 (-),score=48.26 NODE_1174_length_1221_cov_354.323328:265-1143(-)